MPKKCIVCGVNSKQGYKYCKKHKPPEMKYNPKLADPAYRKKRARKEYRKLQRNQYAGWKPSKGAAKRASKQLRKIAADFDIRENRCRTIINSTGLRCKNSAMEGGYNCRQHLPKARLRGG